METSLSPGTTAANAVRAMSHPDVTVKERRYLKGVMALRGMSRGAMGRADHPLVH